MDYLKEIGDVSLTSVPLYKKGKVRNVFEYSDKLIIAASDRISAFDYVLPTLIPYKGIVLNQISKFWFEKLSDIIPNHMISCDVNDYPDLTDEEKVSLNKRSMLVKKTNLVPMECIVRGYISGSGWKEYQRSSSVCGIELPAGYEESCKLSEPIFTPSTKPEEGHDENITHAEGIDLVGKEVFEVLKEKSIALYSAAEKYAREKGIIIADTKFEFGVDDDGEIILIDEALTPDSSRFWEEDKYEVGISPPSYDKQFVRDYLLSLDWNMEPPVPNLPKDIVDKTIQKYMAAYSKVTGKELDI